MEIPYSATPGCRLPVAPDHTPGSPSSLAAKPRVGGGGRSVVLMGGRSAGCGTRLGPAVRHPGESTGSGAPWSGDQEAYVTLLTEDERAELRDAVRLSAVALRDAGIPFALCGGYAVFALGGPEPHHDADFVIRPQDADLAREAPAEAGLELREPAGD